MAVKRVQARKEDLGENKRAVASSGRGGGQRAVAGPSPRLPPLAAIGGYLRGTLIEDTAEEAEVHPPLPRSPRRRPLQPQHHARAPSPAAARLACRRGRGRRVGRGRRLLAQRAAVGHRRRQPRREGGRERPVGGGGEEDGAGGGADAGGKGEEGGEGEEGGGAAGRNPVDVGSGGVGAGQGRKRVKGRDGW